MENPPAEQPVLDEAVEGGWEDLEDLEDMDREPQSIFSETPENEMLGRASLMTKGGLPPSDPNSSPVDTSNFVPLDEIPMDSSNDIPMDEDGVTTLDGPPNDRGPASDPAAEALSSIRNLEEEQALLNGLDLSTPQGTKDLGDRYFEHFRRKIEEQFGDKSPEFKKDLLDSIIFNMLEKQKGANAGTREVADSDWVDLESIGREPATAMKMNDPGLMAGPGGGYGGVGAAATGLVASSLMDEDEPPTTPEVQQQQSRTSDIEMGLGSRLLSNPEARRLYNMSDEQLAEEVDSELKDRIVEIKGEQRTPRYKGTASPAKGSLLPGYEEWFVEGDYQDSHFPIEDKVDYYVYTKQARSEIKAALEKKGTPYDSLDFYEQQAQWKDIDKLANEKYIEAKKGKGTEAWTRGFAANPDTWVIFEAQRNNADPNSSGNSAIEDAIKKARKRGYKNIGIVDSDSVTKIQGHRIKKPWAITAYDKMFPKKIGKILKQSPTEKSWTMGHSLEEAKEALEKAVMLETGKGMSYVNVLLRDFEGERPPYIKNWFRDRGDLFTGYREELYTYVYLKYANPVKDINYRVFSLEGNDKSTKGD